MPRRTPSILLTSLLLALVATGSASAQAVCEGYTKISRLGGNNAFSDPIKTREDLAALFEGKRADIENMLREIGWEGNQADLFQAVADGGASRQSFEPGTPLGWMVFRRGGAAAIRRDLCWAGREAFEGWEVQFASNGTWYSMVVPEACGNLALLAQAPEPICSLKVDDAAGSTCENTTITVDASGSTGTVSVEVTTPSGQKRTLTAADSSSALRWNFDSDERKGTFRFKSTSTVTTPRGTSIMCSAEESVNRACKDPEPPKPAAPTCSIDLPSEDIFDGDEFIARVNAAAGQGTSIDSVTFDGEAITAPYEVTLTADGEGPRTVRAEVTDAIGQSSSCEATATILPKPYRGWSITPFLSRIDTSDDQQRFDLGGGERQAFWFDGGQAIGAQAEYRFNKWLGLGFGAFFGGLESNFELDFIEHGREVWDMTDEDSDTFGLFAGPIFHLTPESRVDLFVGPLIGYLDYGSVDFNLQGRNFRRSYDSETALGAQLGLDIPFKADGKWSLYLGAMYFDVSAESDNEVPNFDIDLEPLFLNLGLSYDFF
ncbi:MAG: outer membrane beta-barrel protein [Acidobacteriota bacterium]